MSVGISASQLRPFDYEQTFAVADRALYAAKAAGRNCVGIADDGDPGTIRAPGEPGPSSGSRCEKLAGSGS